MDTQNKQHPMALHLAALALGKLKPEVAAKVRSHVDECDECKRYVSDTPRHELAEIIKQARDKPASQQNTPATGLSGTIGIVTAPLLAQPTSDAKPQAAGSTPSSGSLVEHGISQKELPPDLFAQSKYQIVRKLGRGGMGTVYEAEHVRMKRSVAIKVINPELVDHPQALARFEEEIRAVASLDHANIARAFDAENIGSLQVFVMEFIRGQTLYELLRSRGRLKVVEACRCVRQALHGLQHAHEHGRVHRDLKPQNLMLTRDTGQIKILDFGLSKAVSENRQSQGLTGSNATMGTCAYLAPEQALDAASADIRADIYSLGCTLYLLLSGSLPFNYDSATKLLLAHQNETARPLHMVCADVPEGLSNLVARMLDKDPAKRPQTPREAADALLPFARGNSASGTAIELSARPQAVAGRGMERWKWGGIAAAVVAVVGIGGWVGGVFSDRAPAVIDSPRLPAASGDKDGVEAPADDLRASGRGRGRLATASSQQPGSLDSLQDAELDADVLTVGGVAFPAGEISFVDQYKSFKPGPGTAPPHRNPQHVLGVPNFERKKWLSAGKGGELVVEFVDNSLVASGDNKPDLCIYEGGTQQEPIAVAISTNGSDWIDLGEYKSGTQVGASVPIDIDAKPGVSLGTRYQYVKIIDKSSEFFPGGAGGADLSGIGAISTVPMTADGFVPLFNGKNLEGWRTHASLPGDWSVKDGAITGQAGISHLYSDGDGFRDVHVRVKLRMNEGGSCGVYVRGGYGPKAENTPEGLAVTLNAQGGQSSSAGMLWSGGELIRDFGSEPLPANETIQLEIVAREKHATVLVNGKVVDEFENTTYRLSWSGHIILQSQLGEVEFESVEVKALSAADPTDVAVEPLATGTEKSAADSSSEKPSAVSSSDQHEEIERLFPLHSRWTGTWNHEVATARVVIRDGNMVVFEVSKRDSADRQFWCRVDGERVILEKNEPVGRRPGGKKLVINSNIKVSGTIVDGQVSLTGTQDRVGPKGGTLGTYPLELELRRADGAAVE